MIFLAFLAGFFGLLAVLLVLKALGAFPNQKEALLASEKAIRGEVAQHFFELEKKLLAIKGDFDTRLLKVIEDTNKSLASLQAQIATNPYYEYDAKQYTGRKAPLPEGIGMPADDNYKMSNGAGGI